MNLSFWEICLISLIILICIQVIPAGIAGYYRNKAKGLAQGLHDTLQLITKKEKEKHDEDQRL